MPSAALAKFKNNIIDVERLVTSHAALNHAGGGRRGLGHITRSGVVMLCAAWELYVEDLLVESAAFLVNQHTDPLQLPLPVQKALSSNVRSARHDLKPLELAGDGWRAVHLAYASQNARALHTPKSANIDDLYRDYLGIQSLSAEWANGSKDIDAFVGVRGDIAHRGRDADYVNIETLKEYLRMVRALAIETDELVALKLKDSTPNGKKPWRRAQ